MYYHGALPHTVVTRRHYHGAPLYTIVIHCHYHGAPSYTIIACRHYLVPSIHYAHIFHFVIISVRCAPIANPTLNATFSEPSTVFLIMCIHVLDVKHPINALQVITQSQYLQILRVMVSERG